MNEFDRRGGTIAIFVVTLQEESVLYRIYY